MDTEDVVTRWYEALRSADLESFAGLHDADVVYDIVGRTPISGRWLGAQVMFERIVPQVFAALDPESLAFAEPYRVFAVDGDRAAGLMRGGGQLASGEEYQQVYCHLFEVHDGAIVHVWEFFDTELAQARLFGKAIDPAGPPENAFAF